MSRTIKCDPANPDSGIIDSIVSVLDAGQVVVMPTETQYSLSIRADITTALDQICGIKKRDRQLLPALFVKDIDMARQFCEINTTAEILAKSFLPGPLTLVVPMKSGQNVVPEKFASDLGFGLRISSSPVLKAVMNRVDYPVTATSANISGLMPDTNIREISKLLGEQVALYIDAGLLRCKIPSTVISAGDEISILRQGIIAKSEIEKSLKEGNIDEPF
ncbi:MAG: threonylcarbamoyl-AMP synthase [candidate division Zixibacteria bacterium]|nr:threonylcarbamoyl-AMP synthase [candidate division Zixibacteria bacterium]